MARVLATATMQAALGEWVQGWIGGGEALVSLVVAWKSSVEVCIPDENDTFRQAGEKALRAFETAKRIFSGNGKSGTIPSDGFINVINPLPPARGLATSTMDIAGTFAAVAACADRRPTDEELLSLCSDIEPSDGIMFKGLALVDHINGKLIERLPPPPDMHIVALIPSRTLDTADYRRNASTLNAIRAGAREHELAYETLKRGLEKSDAALVAQGATLSAEAQQRIMPCGEWDVITETARASGALGIAVAHSGTASGILYAPSNKFGADLAENMLRSAYSNPLAPKAAVRRTTVSGGGFLSEKI